MTYTAWYINFSEDVNKIKMISYIQLRDEGFSLGGWKTETGRLGNWEAEDSNKKRHILREWCP